MPELESSSSSESLATFRAQIAAENEAEIYARIRNLENNLYYLIPPQTHPGEYEAIVREHFDSATSVDQYRKIWDQEYIELKVWEKKGILQDRLHSMLLSEQNLDRILDLSPYKDIREEAYDFIERKVEPVNPMRDSFQRDTLVEGSLTSFISELDQNGRNSLLYREFFSHFTDEEFRRRLGLPLP